MKLELSLIAGCFIFGAVALAPMGALAHGDVTPQAVDTQALPQLGKELRKENPYRGLAEAAKVGYSGYTQNCARCHGLEAVSGGMSPDLRVMDSECLGLKDEAKKQACFSEVDVYYMSATMKGRARNGAVYMPPYEATLTQEAIWAIKAYLETRRVAD